MWATPAQMKKGRPGIVLSALARPPLTSVRRGGAAARDEHAGPADRQLAALGARARQYDGRGRGRAGAGEGRPARRRGPQRRARARRLRGRRARGRVRPSSRCGRPRSPPRTARRMDDGSNPGSSSSAGSPVSAAPSWPSPAASTPRWSRRSPPARSAGALAVTAVSPALAERRARRGARVAAAVGIAHETITPTSSARGLPPQRSRSLLPLQDRALRRARRPRPERGYAALLSGANADDRRRLASGPAARRRSTASCTRYWRPARPSRRCGRSPASSASRARRKPQARASPRASPTARVSTRQRSRRSIAPSAPSGSSATASFACATTATSARLELPQGDLERALDRSVDAPICEAIRSAATPERTSTPSRSAPAGSTRPDQSARR